MQVAFLVDRGNPLADECRRALCMSIMVAFLPELANQRVIATTFSTGCTIRSIWFASASKAWVVKG
jgi:hypothetical protein